jgi:hypothetical protein
MSHCSNSFLSYWSVLTLDLHEFTMIKFLFYNVIMNIKYKMKERTKAMNRNKQNRNDLIMHIEYRITSLNNTLNITKGKMTSEGLPVPENTIAQMELSLLKKTSKKLQEINLAEGEYND